MQEAHDVLSNKEYASGRKSDIVTVQETPDWRQMTEALSHESWETVGQDFLV